MKRGAVGADSSSESGDVALLAYPRDQRIDVGDCSSRIAQGPTASIVVEAPLVRFVTATFEVPATAAHLEALEASRRDAEVVRILELGTHAVQTLDTSSTILMVEAQIAEMSSELSSRLGQILTKDRGLAAKELGDLLNEHRARVQTTVGRYLDPESQSSLPAVMAKHFDTATAAFVIKVEKLLAEDGEASALGRLAAHMSNEMEKATIRIVEQMAARHALATRSSLSGRPYEDAVEELATNLTRLSGDTVQRCGDTLGEARTKAGDVTITLDPTLLRGAEARLVLEAKRRGANGQAFSLEAISKSLTAARRNRRAQGGVFVVDSPSLLPLGLPFKELGGNNIAVAWQEDGDDYALAAAIGILRHSICADILRACSDNVDADAACKIVDEIRATMTRVTAIRTGHQAAINSINKASVGTDELVASVLDALRRLDDVLRG